MALRTQTYETGDYAYQSWSNGYKIHLILTEESVDNVNNTSLISYLFKISTTDNNQFVLGPYSWTINIGGDSIPINDFDFVVYYNTEQIIAQGQITVAHNADGTLAMPFSAPIPANLQDRTKYAPPAMILEGNMDLTPIAVVPTTIPVVFNGEQLTSVVFNGQPVTQLNFNGVAIF